MVQKVLGVYVIVVKVKRIKLVVQTTMGCMKNGCKDKCVKPKIGRD